MGVSPACGRSSLVAAVFGVMTSGSAGCSGDDGATMRDGGGTSDAGIDAMPAQCPRPIGDQTAPAEIEIIHLGGNGDMVVTAPDSEIPIRLADQGNFAFSIGARARNVDGCALTLQVEIQDCDGVVVGGATIERGINLIEAADGWGVPRNRGYYGYPNACPRAESIRDVNGSPHRAEVRITDSTGKEATASVDFIPVCLADDVDGCDCSCDDDYVFGGGCPPVDDGVPPASCPP